MGFKWKYNSVVKEWELYWYSDTNLTKKWIGFSKDKPNWGLG